MNLHRQIPYSPRQGGVDGASQFPQKGLIYVDRERQRDSVTGLTGAITFSATILGRHGVKMGLKRRQMANTYHISKMPPGCKSHADLSLVP